MEPPGKEIDEKKKAKFHGAFFYTERLNELFKALDTVTVQRRTNDGSTKIWYHNYYLLMSLFKEIYPKMDKKEKEDHKEAAGKVKKALDGAVKTFESKQKVSDKFFNLFDEWEMELRVIIDNKGLIMPDKNSALDAMELI